ASLPLTDLIDSKAVGPLAGLGSAVAERTEPEQAVADPGGSGGSSGEEGEGDSAEAGGGAGGVVEKFFESEDGDGLLASLLKATNLEQLRQMLDDLDDMDGNVTLTQTGGVTTFDVQIEKDVHGQANLNVSALGGSLYLTGKIDVAAVAELHLVFGVDSKG